MNESNQYIGTTIEKRGNHTVDDINFCRFVIRSLPSAVLTVDSELRITSFNPWAEEITGYVEEEVLGRYCGEVLQGGKCKSSCPLKAVLECKDHVVRIETTIENKWGETIPVRMNTGGLFDDEGELIGGLEAFHDISYLKVLEREKNNMISMIAHDMRSPLISIDGFILRLLKRTSDDKTKNYLNIMLREARKLESLIDEFLEFSRLQSGRLKLDFTETSLDRELHELCETYEPGALKRGIKIELHSDEALPIIQADGKRLHRALSNLLDNAIKYSEEGGSIHITTQDKDEKIMVKIVDEGAGIDPRELPYIFDPFHRGKEVKEKDGFGIGLAAVRTIVEGHGGRIQVKSELDKGSMFTVVLPKTMNSEEEVDSGKILEEP